jgi:hypothetical protein
MQDPKNLGRQLRRLSISRSIWKDRAALKQRHILSLRVKVRDLQASRDSWKLRAVAAESAPVICSPQLALCPPLESVPNLLSKEPLLGEF